MQVNTIGVMTSGGDSPGMNAAIRAIVRTALYNNLKVYGILRGYEGMINGDFKEMDSASVGNILQQGGTILKTARSKAFMTAEGRKQAAEQLAAYEIDAVVAVGGNGTFTGATVFNKEHNIPFIGLPGTIDNDLYGTDYTIGFDTAVNTAIDAVDKIRDTADSHDRLFFVEVMGRDSGYIALHTGLGSGAGHIFLPESETTVESLVSYLDKSLRRKRLFNLVIVAEGNKNGNAMQIAEKVKQLTDKFDIRVTVIGHLQRGGSPTCMDRVLATRLGHAAVEALIKGKHNCMAGIVNDRIVFTPFEDAITKKKELDLSMKKVAEILAL